MLYLVLAATAAGVGILALRRGSAPLFVAALVGMGASIGAADGIVVYLFDLFQFRPGLLVSPGQDSKMGMLLADLIAVPLLFSSTLTLFPRHRVIAGTVLGLLLGLIEWLFVGLGIFNHGIWSVSYTVGLFLIRFAIALWWVSWFERTGYTRGFRLWITMLTVVYLWYLWLTPISGVLEMWAIRPGWLHDAQADWWLGALFYHSLPFGAAAMPFLWRRWGENRGAWVWLWAAFTAYFAELAATGLWQGWSPALEGLGLTLLVGIAVAADRWISAAYGPRVSVQ